MNKKQIYKISIISLFIIGLGVILILYFYFIQDIKLGLEELQGIYLLITLTSIKILVVFTIGLVLIKGWFQQEEQYLSDLPFLAGSFFLILIPAKFLDLLSAFLKDYVKAFTLLLILKVRYILAILNLIPMIYLSIGMILFYISLKKRTKSLQDEKKRELLQKYLILLITLIESIVVILTPNYKELFNILPFLVIPSLIVIVWVFAFAYKNGTLTQINPLIVSIGFGIYLGTALFRSLGQYIFDIATYILLSEIFEIITFIIIFIGLIKKKSFTSKLY